MQTVVECTVVILVILLISRIFRRQRKVSQRKVKSRGVPKLSFVVVNGDQARVEPYPFVYVNIDGSVWELHPNERKYLETPFDPCDGARPYIKDTYLKKNGWGEISGFLKRSDLPMHTQIHPAPTEDPCKPLFRQDQIQILRNKGFEVIEESDRVITVKKPKRKEGE